jgi:uncharacterized protein (DUF1778 family)
MTKTKAAPPKESWIKKTGRKPVIAAFDPESHEKIRQAAFESRKSMAQFVHDSALTAAEKKLGK